jgi:hypothetical protein
MSSADRAIQIFMQRRDRISHGLLKNVFFSALQPCWDGTGRCTEQDVVYKALRGEVEVAKDFLQVMKFWKDELRPELDQLTGGVRKRYGFVVTDQWTIRLNEYKQAADLLSSFIGSGDTFPHGDPSELASRFWSAVDVIGNFVRSMKTDFSRFFYSWDPNLITEATHD